MAFSQFEQQLPMFLPHVLLCVCKIRQLLHVKGGFSFLLLLSLPELGPSVQTNMFLQTQQSTDNSPPDKYVYSQANIIFVIPSILPCKDWMNILLCQVSNAVFLFYCHLSQWKGEKELWREKEVHGCKKWISKRWIKNCVERKRDSREVEEKGRRRWRECTRE